MQLFMQYFAVAFPLSGKFGGAVELNVTKEIHSFEIQVCWWRKVYSLMLQAFTKPKEFSRLSCWEQVAGHI